MGAEGVRGGGGSGHTPDSLVSKPWRRHPASCGPDGRLDMGRVLWDFAELWRENGDILADGMSSHEVAAQLVIMAWLQWVRMARASGSVWPSS